ncbi:MAG: tetratricopeptide repeat protein [Spirochaetota bacterium]|nr:tetratricopeptide repeat protein [Spirochaetota bacterium]
MYSGYFEEGCKLYIQKKYDIAKEKFLQSAKKYENGNAYYFLGEIEKVEGNFKKSEEYFRAAITKRISKKYLQLAYWNLIVIKEQDRSYKEMVQLCQELWERTGDDGAKKKVESLINKLLWTDNQDAIDLYQQGIILKRKTKIDEAKSAFFEAIELDSSFMAPKFEIGLQYYKEGKIDYSINYLMSIAEKIPFYGEIHLLLGNIYFNRQLFTNSIPHFDKALVYGFLDKKAKFALRLKRGTSYYNTLNYDKAKVDIEKILEFDKKSIEPLLLLSAIYIKEANYDDALKTLNKAEMIHPVNAEIIFQIGSIYYKKQDTKYIALFDRLFNKVYSSNSEIPNKYYKAFIILIKYYFNNARYSRASEIIEFLPDNFKDYDIILISAKTYYNLSSYDKSIEYFEKINLTNDDRYTLCKAYTLSEMIDKARDILWSLSYYDDYFNRAKNDQILKELALNIEKEKNRIIRQNTMNESNAQVDEDKDQIILEDEEIQKDEKEIVNDDEIDTDKEDTIDDNEVKTKEEMVDTEEDLHITE